MAQNLTFDAGHAYFSDDGDSFEKDFTSDFGQWYFIVKRAGNSFAGVISLKPASSLIDLSNTKVKIKFTHNFSDFNFTTDANKIPDQQCFLFAAALMNFRNNNCYCRYRIEIEIGEISVPVLASYEDDSPSAIDHSKEMFNSGKLADITITASDKKQIKAHNYILSRSPVFDAMLNAHDTKEAQEKAITIKDIEYEVLVEMLRYMYTDQVPEIKDMACGLLVAANKYDLPGLGNICHDFLVRNITCEGFTEVWIVANQLELEQLKAAAVAFFKMKRNEIFATEGWKELENTKIKLVVDILKKFAIDS